MSIHEAPRKGPEWPSYSFQSSSTADLDLGQQSSVTLGIAHGRSQMPENDSRPNLEPHKSFQYNGNSPDYSIPYFQRHPGQATVPGATKRYSSPECDHTFTSSKNNSGPIATTYSATTLTSPTSQHVPLSGGEEDESAEDDDEMLITAGEPGGEVTEHSVPKTAAERRAEKRKMKRFRYGGSVVIPEGFGLLYTEKIDSQSNSFPHERVHPSCSSGRGTTGATLQRNSWLKPPPGAGLVSKQVRTFQPEQDLVVERIQTRQVETVHDR